MSQATPPGARTSTRQPSRTAVLQRRIVVGFVVLCGLALALAAFRVGTRSADVQAQRADPQDSALVAQGKQLYATRCASCHGANLEGAAGWPQRDAGGLLPAAPLGATSSLVQRADSWIFQTIKHGGQSTAPAGTRSAMPASSGGLTDSEIWAVISYIKSTWPAEARAAQP